LQRLLDIDSRRSARVDNGPEVTSDPTKMLQDFTSHREHLFRLVSDATLVTSAITLLEANQCGATMLAY
jgi:hypothetical protein